MSLEFNGQGGFFDKLLNLKKIKNEMLELIQECDIFWDKFVNALAIFSFSEFYPGILSENRSSRKS